MHIFLNDVSRRVFCPPASAFLAYPSIHTLVTISFMSACMYVHAGVMYVCVCMCVLCMHVYMNVLCRNVCIYVCIFGF